MRSLALCACLFAAAAPAYADPLVGASLPDGTRWVVHLDVDAARAAKPLWELARVKIWEPRAAELEPKLAMLERAASMPRDQLHDVTLFGTAFDPTSACIRIHGTMDKDSLATLLRLDKSFSQIDHNGHDIFTWQSQGQQIFAGFDAHLPAGPINTWVIVSPQMSTVAKALDAMDSKGSVKADSPLLPAAAPAEQPLFWMAAQGLSDLTRMQPVESPILTQLDSASLALRWNNTRVIAEIQLDAKSAQTAQQLQSVAEGIKAYVALTAADEHALPRVRMLSSALQQFNVKTDGKTVKGDWSVEVDKVETLLNLVLQEQAAGAGGAGNATTSVKP